MNKPWIVAISDIHFNINNLELATKALTMAFEKARELEVPLVVAGDLQDTKAIIRAEVMNRLIDIFRHYDETHVSRGVKSYVLVGNHDLINEKGSEHALTYLELWTSVVGSKSSILDNDLKPTISMLSYCSSLEKFREKLSMCCTNIVLCHQGIKGAYMGDYIQDNTSIDPSELKDFRAFSGHYHRHQTVGNLTYIGSPFTHTWGEANDGEKGFLVINEDGTYERVLTNLRKHIVQTVKFHKMQDIYKCPRPEDLVKIRILGPKSGLDEIERNRQWIETFVGRKDFTLQLIPEISETKQILETEDKTAHEVMDTIIDDLKETDSRKAMLKAEWREVLK